MSPVEELDLDAASGNGVLIGSVLLLRAASIRLLSQPGRPFLEVDRPFIVIVSQVTGFGYSRRTPANGDCLKPARIGPTHGAREDSR